MTATTTMIRAYFSVRLIIGFHLSTRTCAELVDDPKLINGTIGG